MIIEIKEKDKNILDYGDVIITKNDEYLLVTDNNIDLPCQCSQSIGRVLLVDLITSKTYDMQDLEALNRDTSDIKRIIKKDKLKLMEVQ